MVLLAGLGWQVCHKITGFRGSEGLARVLVGGHARATGTPRRAGSDRRQDDDARGGRNEGGGRRR